MHCFVSAAALFTIRGSLQEHRLWRRHEHRTLLEVVFRDQFPEDFAAGKVIAELGLHR